MTAVAGLPLFNHTAAPDCDGSQAVPAGAWGWLEDGTAVVYAVHYGEHNSHNAMRAARAVAKTRGLPLYQSWPLGVGEGFNPRKSVPANTVCVVYGVRYFGPIDGSHRMCGPCDCGATHVSYQTDVFYVFRLADGVQCDESAPLYPHREGY